MFNILFIQLHAAYLNILSGAGQSQIVEPMIEASDWLNKALSGSDITQYEQQRAISLAKAIQAYNDGETGPGRCPLETTSLSLFSNNISAAALIADTGDHHRGNADKQPCSSYACSRDPHSGNHYSRLHSQQRRRRQLNGSDSGPTAQPTTPAPTPQPTVTPAPPTSLHRPRHRPQIRLVPLNPHPLQPRLKNQHPPLHRYRGKIVQNNRYPGI